MKSLITILLFFSVIFINHAFAATNNQIQLQTTIRENGVDVSFIATNIAKPLIGISTTLHIPSSLTYQKYDVGNFFEQSQNQTTYLISPKKTDPTTIIIGIASLGKATPAKNGTIVTLHFLNSSLEHKPIQLTLDHNIASGITNEKRVNYADIIWTNNTELSQTGPNILLVLTLTSIILGTFITLKLSLNTRPKENK